MPPKKKIAPPKRKNQASAKKKTPPPPSRKKKAPAWQEATAALLLLQPEAPPAAPAARARTVPKEATHAVPKYTKDMPIKNMIKQLEREVVLLTCRARHRHEVKEKILKTYELHDGARKLEALLEGDEVVKNNSLLVAQFQTSLESMRTERDEILAIRDDLLYPWERDFRAVVKRKIETGGVSFRQKDDPHMASWIFKQRARNQNLDKLKTSTGKRSGDMPTTLEDCSLLKRIGVDLDYKPPAVKSFEERFQEVVAYKEKHGNLKIPRLTEGSNLGEWVAKIRREHDRIQQGESSINLTPVRIQAMTDLGFIWKVRFGRPKKGDPKFRLRRKKPGEEEHTTLEENRADHNEDGTATTASAGS
jgi:hypothetical protein